MSTDTPDGVHTLIAAAATLAAQEEASAGGPLAETRQRLDERLLWWIDRLDVIDTERSWSRG